MNKKILDKFEQETFLTDTSSIKRQSKVSLILVKKNMETAQQLDLSINTSLDMRGSEERKTEPSMTVNTILKEKKTSFRCTKCG